MLAEHRWLSAADGWNCYSGHNIMMHSIGIGMECAHLLSGDAKYLDLLRSQMKLLMDNAMTAPAGHTNKLGADCSGALIAPARYGDDGWSYYSTRRPSWLVRFLRIDSAAV